MGGSSRQTTSPAADAQARIAQQLYRQTDPVRKGLIDQATDFVQGGFDPTTTPMYGALKGNLESQFARARDATIASTPAGGGLSAALADLETKRALGLTNVAGDLYGQERANAMQIGTGSTGTAVAGLGSAGAIQAQLAAADSQREAGIWQGLGTGIGTAVGMGMGAK